MSSGSVVANVVGTGTVTIPLIKQRGFSGKFAGGLEAAASTGGQIMPPVMGAAAFLMAQLTGNSYGTICLAALVPALFYYYSLFLSVESEARRLGIEPQSVNERQKLEPGDIWKSTTFLLPVAAILITLALGRSPAMAGFWAVLATLAGGLVFNPELRKNPGTLLGALARGGMAGAQVMMAVATIGILIGIFELTGLGLRFASEVAALTTEGLILPLILTALACLILGMGMPTSGVYVLLAALVAPSLVQAGIDPIAAHLFILYFGMMSMITPPATANPSARPAQIAAPHRDVKKAPRRNPARSRRPSACPTRASAAKANPSNA